MCYNQSSVLLKQSLQVSTSMGLEVESLKAQLREARSVEQALHHRSSESEIFMRKL